MAFLTLTSEISQPFVIPSLSPVSQPSSRKNSDASVKDIDAIDRMLNNGNMASLQSSAIDASADSQHRARKGSLSLL
ncbi:Spo24 protein [Maudiozyma humilis]|uniref:Spo24 protein n=1 Tax=Maudiozyma humilis TaxID=51915 RepID=A0AAV5RVK9_MAUHU|nr:Spo24 protein [Kazachstania humilis]